MSFLVQTSAAAAGGAASAATNAGAQHAAPATGVTAASDGATGNNAASAATGKYATRANGRNAPTRSSSQDIPKGKTTPTQRMTRAAAARAAAELADTAPGGVEEEDDMEDDMAEGEYEMVRDISGSAEQATDLTDL